MSGQCFLHNCGVNGELNSALKSNYSSCVHWNSCQLEVRRVFVHCDRVFSRSPRKIILILLWRITTCIRSLMTPIMVREMYRAPKIAHGRLIDAAAALVVTDEQRGNGEMREEKVKAQERNLISSRPRLIIRLIHFDFGDNFASPPFVSFVIKGWMERHRYWRSHNPAYVLVIIASENIKHIRDRLNDQILFSASHSWKSFWSPRVWVSRSPFG